MLSASILERAEPWSSVTPEQNQDYRTFSHPFPTLPMIICYPINTPTPQQLVFLGGTLEIHSSVFSLGCLKNKLSLCCKAPQDRVSGWSVLILFFSSIVQFGGFFVLVVCCCTESLSCSMQDLQFSLRDLQTFSCGVRPSSPTRDQTRAPCIGSTAS